MMPMSPDDYKALSQYVSPRDIAVVSTAEFGLLLRAVQNRITLMSVSLLALLSGRQSDLWI